MNIYVGNLNYRVREDDLKQVMEEYGTVESVKIIKDRETGKSKGFGFVEMPDDEAAKKAIAELNEAEYEGRQMVVKEARPKLLLFRKKIRNFCLSLSRSFFMLKNMFLKGIYAGKPAIFQLIVLLLLILAGAVFSSLIAMGLFYMIYGLHADITLYPDMMRLLQLISALGTFLFPTLALAWLCSSHPKEYLSIGKMPKGRILLLTLLSIFLLTPSISLTGILNKQMELPSFMEPIENWMRAQEETAEQLTLKLLAGEGIITLFFNLIVIAVTAGVTEEFLFRGALQRVIGKWTRNHHIIIWSAAILFSAFHMQFFGFLPRMLLGAYFGYLLYWTRNIWIPVFAHFVNNAFAVISMSDASLKDNEFITGDISTQNLLPYTIVAIVALFFFVRCCQKLKIIRSSIIKKQF